ncbi:MAG: CDP-glycerol glycerophosphotransferase family protein [Nitrospinota bacterium]|nr:CDP-glycerol glycerophosphotransferase family protein [Nitrospinota bacterium]
MVFNCGESRGEIETTIKSSPNSEQAIIPRLAEYQAKKIQKDIKPGQKTLAVFYPSKAYRENLGSEDMYNRIRAQGYNVIFLFGVIRGDDFEKRPYSYYAGHDLIGHFNFVNAFIFPTLTPGLPFASKKILLVHDIYDSPKGVAETAPAPSNDGKPQRVPPLLDELDYTFLPCRALMPPSNKLKLIRQKPICRIPGGYIKLDKNIQYFKSIHVPIDSIIFAPTVHWDHFYDYVAVPEHGCDIVGALLEGFPEYKIIFRPHPHTIDTPEVQKVAEAFKDHPQFEFDTNASFYMENYARSQLMITDMSGTAFTYAFTTSRPVVFFSHKDDSVEQVFGKIRYFIDREKIGYVATNVEELRQKVAYILANKTELEQKIGKFRDESIYNIGKAEDYIVENIRYIMESKTHPDWQYVECPIVPRDKPEIPEDTPVTAGIPATHPEPTLIEEGYKNFNIIAFDGMYYGLAQGEGAFEIQKVNQKEYHECFEGDSIVQVKALIDLHSGSPTEN